jgi:hypothetical protein
LGQLQHEQPILLLFVWPFGNCRVLQSGMRGDQPALLRLWRYAADTQANELRGNFLQRKCCTNACRQRSVSVQRAALWRDTEMRARFVRGLAISQNIDEFVQLRPQLRETRGHASEAQDA